MHLVQVRDRELQGVRASLKKALEDKESSVGATKEKVCGSVRVDGEDCVSSVCMGRGITSWDSLLTRTGFTPPRPQVIPAVTFSVDAASYIDPL